MPLLLKTQDVQLVCEMMLTIMGVDVQMMMKEDGQMGSDMMPMMMAVDGQTWCGRMVMLMNQ